jgi:hypothetical protein
MGNFNISIELHDSTQDAYQKLCDKMRKCGFKHSLSDENGIYYRLPPGEFTCSGYLCRQELLDKVFKVIREILPSPKVIVTEVAGRAWRGLEKIDLP